MIFRNEDTLRRTFLNRKDALLSGLNERGLMLDLAFIGNSSALYTWDPGYIIDLDACIFVLEKSLAIGSWLQGLRRV